MTKSTPSKTLKKDVMHDSRTIHSTEIVEELKRVFGDRVYETVVKRSVKFSEAVAAALPIIKYAEDSPGALAYQELAKEILHEQK